MSRYIKGIASDMPEALRGKEAVVRSDYYDIEKAWVNDDGVLCVEFADLGTLQAWNRAWRQRWNKCNNMLEALHFDTASYKRELYLYDTDDYGVCDDCGRIVKKGDLTMVKGGNRVCQDCLDESYSYCEHCDTWYPCDDMVEIHTDTYGRCDHSYWVCPDCADEVAHECESCGKWYANEVCRLGADNEWYCDYCWDDEFVTCCECGEILWRDDAYYDEDSDRWYCEGCYNECCRNGVRSYHNNPRRVYHAADHDIAGENRYIGTEIETEKGNYQKRIEITQNYGNDEEDIYQMHDGSLDSSGIECITQPMTKMYWDAFDFEGWMAALTEAGTCSHDTDDCGLHVHLSRTWLGTDSSDEQAVLVARMRQFIADNQPMVERFARREACRWCVYSKTFEKCDKEHYAKNVRKDLHKKKGYSGDRYQSVNNENRDTVEFRIFRGTLKPNTYRASVEFCLRTVDYITTHEDGEETWHEFVTYKPLPQSMETYMQERNMQTTF